MADEEQTMVEGQEGGDEAPKKGPNKLILFGGIGVVAIVIGIVLALFVIAPMTSGGGDQAEAEPAAEESSHGGHGESEEASDGHGGDDGHGGGHGSSAKGNIYSIDNIIINPAGTGGSRFLSTSISFELGSSQLAKEFETKDVVIRDALITILSSKTVTQLTNPKQREITRYQIRKRVAQLLETEDIEGVYYTDFVLQ